MAQPELIIFDCDGVLVDSEPLANAVLADYLTELGYPVTATDCMERFVGLSLESVRDRIENGSSLILPDDFINEIKRRDHVAFAGRLKPITNILDAIKKIPQLKCVASSGSPDKIDNSLTTTGLIDFFQPHIYSAAEVKNGKPAPDLFLHAAREMNSDPGKTIVIEDSLAGVEAGVRAGMTVLGFCGGGHIPPGHAGKLVDIGATQAFEDMAILPDMIDAL